MVGAPSFPPSPPPSGAAGEEEGGEAEEEERSSLAASVLISFPGPLCVVATRQRRRAACRSSIPTPLSFNASLNLSTEAVQLYPRSLTNPAISDERRIELAMLLASRASNCEVAAVAAAAEGTRSAASLLLPSRRGRRERELVASG